MEDLIASLSGSHMSQENVDLEMVKAHFARTLVVPASPTSSTSTEGSSLPRTRPASMSLSGLQGFTFDSSAQPLPSPTAASFSFEVQPPSYSSTYPSYDGYDDEASLSAAFAGDAFAPMWEKQAPIAAPVDPWRAFHEKQAAQWQQQQGLGIGIMNVNVNVSVEAQQTPVPEYHQYAYDDEAMDEDATEAMLDEEEAVNGGYARGW